MHIGEYIPGNSPIHQLDPRVKIGSTLALSILILRGGSPGNALISAFLSALIPISGVPVTSVMRAFRPVVVFFGLLFCVHLLFTDGSPIPPFPHWRVTVTYEGLSKGAFVTWQFALLILSAAILTMTTPSMGLVSGIERLLRPFGRIGVPSHDLAMMVAIALRFVPTFFEEMDRMKIARMARGAGFKSGSVLRRMRAAVSMLPSLIVQTVKRADDLVTAMEARGYHRGPRTYIRELSMSRSDYVALLVIMAIAGLDVVCQ